MPRSEQYELILNGSRIDDCVSLNLPARPREGEVWQGDVEIVMPPDSPNTKRLLRMAEDIRLRGAHIEWEGSYRDVWADEAGQLSGGVLRRFPLQPTPNYGFVFAFERITAM